MQAQLRAFKLKDEEYLKTAIPVLLRAANAVDLDGSMGDKLTPENKNVRLRFVMLLHSDVRASLWLQYICASLMASDAL